jgi:hypothetical protein
VHILQLLWTKCADFRKVGRDIVSRIRIVMFHEIGVLQTSEEGSDDLSVDGERSKPSL